MAEKKNKKEKDNKSIAVNLIGLAGIEGLGFSSAAELHVLLGVRSVHDVYQACKRGDIAKLPGWGEVRQNKLKNSIEISVMWFQSQCKKKQREYKDYVDEEIAKNMANTIGLDKVLIEEIARAHAESILKKQKGDE